MGVDKIGRPIYIERNGKINVDGVWEAIEEPDLLRAFMWSYENQYRLMMPVCSAIAGKQVAQTLTILDMDGFGMSMMSRKMIDLIKKGSGIMQDNYPETLGQMFIINAPFVFTAAYAIVKNFVDEKTRKKIQVISSSYTQSTLLEAVDEDQLADFLGGKNTSNLIDDVGPWCEWELVDGANPGDVVGVRKKGTD